MASRSSGTPIPFVARVRRRSRVRSRLLVFLLVFGLPLGGCKGNAAQILPVIAMIVAQLAAASSGNAGMSQPGMTPTSMIPGSSMTPSGFPGSNVPGFGPSTSGVPGGIPGFDTTGLTPGAAATNGRSFFKNLPLPQGSWKVGPNGHFYDCRGGGCTRPHHGNDLHAKAGTPIFAVSDGVVSRVKYDGGGYHWYIVVKHQDRSSNGRTYNTLYGHVDVASGIQEGAQVRAGQQIASVSAKEVSSPHCHFEVLIDDGDWKGTPVDPNNYADFHPKGARGETVYAGSPPLGRGLV